MGPEVAAFEREFADYHGMRHGIMVNSGSSANLIMVAAISGLGLIKRGDAVAVPAIAWSTTYAPLIQYGLDLVLMDVDGTWNADVYRDYDLDGVRLIVGCSILGNPANLYGLKSMAGVIGAEFIEDNCESLGACEASIGTQCGTIGLMNSFSFFYSHQISAIEGGMILTNDYECNRLCRMLRAHGWTRDLGPLPSFDTEYDFRMFGYNVRPLELHAAIAREQLRKLKHFTKERKANIGLFRRLTIDMPIQHQEISGIEPSPFGLSFTVSDKEARNRVVKALRAAKIDCRLPTGGSFTKHAYGARWRDQPTPNADRIHDTGLFLGCAPFDISDRIGKAVQVMREIL